MSGNLQEALDNYLFSLEIYFELLGKKHLNYAAALTNTGMLYKEIAESTSGLDKVNAMERGEEALLDALSIRQELGRYIYSAIIIKVKFINYCFIPGANARDIITARNALASLRNIQGKFEQAESLLRESLSQAKEAFGYRCV